MSDIRLSTVYVPLDTRIYGLPSSNYLISIASVNTAMGAIHSAVKLWNRGGYIGVVVLPCADVEPFLEKLGLVAE